MIFDAIIGKIAVHRIKIPDYEYIEEETDEENTSKDEKTSSTVNFAMVQVYWQINYMIVKHEQNGNLRTGYGKSVLKQLSCQLTKNLEKGSIQEIYAI